jgi:hypothetical protein
VDDVKVVLNRLRSWNIGHVKREANSAAHILAKEVAAGTLEDERIWMEETPLCISDIVFLEQSALSS